MAFRSRRQKPFSTIHFILTFMIQLILRLSSDTSLLASRKGRLLIVSYTERGDSIRLISAREVTRSEREAYEEE
jgi:hypothetical protein